jgi:polysaccharide biosynthesis/export protein
MEADSAVTAALAEQDGLPSGSLVMKITWAEPWHKELSLGLACLFLVGCLWAQTPGGSESGDRASAPAAMASLTQPVSTAVNKPHDDSFVIGNDDLLAINVWKEPDLSRAIPVRSDGRISLPLVGEVQAAGQTPLKLEQDIASKLQPYLEEPEVTVIVQQINSQKFNILGQVGKPGSYPITNSATVLDAIALAGGCRDFAKRSSIYILRHNPDGSESRIPFNYKDVIKGKNMAQNIKLQPHDTIVVP